MAYIFIVSVTDQHTAIDIIARAEKDLGPLSQGQKRDLLADNTDWNFSYIAAVVKAISSDQVKEVTL